MTISLFDQWLNDFNELLQVKRRNILLIVDNTGHNKTSKYSNIRLEYLASNMISAIQ